MIDLTIFSAVVAAVLTFFSPCILPLIPVYFSMITGFSYSKYKGAKEDKELQRKVIKKTIANTLAFSVGFTLVFVILGVAASSLSQILRSNRLLIMKIAGSVTVLFGIMLLLEDSVPFLSYTKSPLTRKRQIEVSNFAEEKDRIEGTIVSPENNLQNNLQNNKNENKLKKNTRISSLFAPFLLGLSFALGWTPCISPILGAILMTAATLETIKDGILLLAVYSITLSIIFLIFGIILVFALNRIKNISKNFRYIRYISSFLLIITGILMFINKLALS